MQQCSGRIEWLNLQPGPGDEPERYSLGCHVADCELGSGFMPGRGLVADHAHDSRHPTCKEHLG